MVDVKKYLSSIHLNVKRVIHTQLKLFPGAQNSVCSSKSKSVIKLEVLSCKNEILQEFLPSCKKYCWKVTHDKLLKFLDILIGNVSFGQFITQLQYFKKLDTLIFSKVVYSSNLIQYYLIHLKHLALQWCCWVFYLPKIYIYFIIHLSCRINIYTFKRQWSL